MMHKTILLATALVCLAAAGVQANQAYVIDRGGQRINGVKIETDAQGNLTLFLDDTVRRTFRRGNYREAFIPQPDGVTRLQAAYNANRFDLVLENAPRLFEEFKFLGWGGYIGYLEGMAYVRTNKFTEAMNTFRRIEPHAGSQIDKVREGQVRALLGLNRLDDAQKLLEQMAATGDDSIAAFVFNARGKILAEQGKQQEAVLEYLKTLLLFTDDQVRNERNEARTNVVALLTRLGDPRAQEFANIK